LFWNIDFQTDPPAPQQICSVLLIVWVINARCSAAIERMRPDMRTVTEGCIGRTLAKAIENVAGLNIMHAADVTCRAHTRLLKRMMSGRSVWSKPLSDPMVRRLHDFAPEERPEPDRWTFVRQDISRLL
jgi:hypothetical protein